VLVEEVVLLFEVFSAHSMSWATNVFHYPFLFLCWTEVMNISEGTVVTALKVGRPRKTPLPAPGGKHTLHPVRILFDNFQCTCLSKVYMEFQFLHCVVLNSREKYV
jgi:hypothetical protein